MTGHRTAVLHNKDADLSGPRTIAGDDASEPPLSVFARNTSPVHIPSIRARANFDDGLEFTFDGESSAEQRASDPHARETLVVSIKPPLEAKRPSLVAKYGPPQRIDSRVPIAPVAVPPTAPRISLTARTSIAANRLLRRYTVVSLIFGMGIGLAASFAIHATMARSHRDASNASVSPESIRQIPANIASSLVVAREVGNANAPTAVAPASANARTGDESVPSRVDQNGNSIGHSTHSRASHTGEQPQEPYRPDFVP